MNCPLKPSLTCAGTPQLADEGRCIGCPAGRANGHSTRSLKLYELPLNDYFVILREQLRGQLAEAEKAQKPKSLVKPTNQGLVKGDWPTLSQGQLVKGSSQGLDLAGEAT